MKSGAGGRTTDQIILALLENGTLEKAAASLGISGVTLWRWLKKPESEEAYRKARRDAFSRSIARLQHAGGAAVTTLLKVMVDKEPLQGAGSAPLIAFWIMPRTHLSWRTWRCACGKWNRGGERSDDAM